MSPFNGGYHIAEDTTMTKRLTRVPELTAAINIPLRLLRARERLTLRLERTFKQAMTTRAEECKKAGIPYLSEAYNMKSPDRTYDALGEKCTQYHVEHLGLMILVSKLEHIVYKASNGRIWGGDYTEDVKSVLGNRSVASCII